MQVARAANRQLLELPASWQPQDTEAALAVVSSELGSEQEQTRLDALHWVNVLLARDRATVRPLDILRCRLSMIRSDKYTKLIDRSNKSFEFVLVGMLAAQTAA